MDVLEICAKMIRNAVSTMSAKFSAHVKDEINTKVSSLYKPGGTATLATLPALTEENSGYVYDMSESFTTTANFREGAGHKYPAGTNVVVSDVGNGVYKYDVLSGMLDGYVQESRKIGNVPLSADIPVTLTGDTAITVTNTGTASAIGYSVTHNDSGVTAGSKGDTTNQTPGFGGTFKALSATVDAKGHVTALSDHTVKVPSDTATTSKDGLMSKGDKAKLDNLSVTASNPLEVTKTGETYNVTLKDSGVTAGSKGDTTNQTPGFGGTFKALSATVDAKGRVTSLAEHTIEVPDTEATQSSAGLMSKEDKAKLDKVVPKGSASKGIYIDSGDNLVEMTYKLEADVPSGFAPGTAVPAMDGTAAAGSSMKYAREDHIHPVDTSRASAVDVTALQTENGLLKELICGIDAPVYRTASGNPAMFSDGYAANVKELSVEITPTQEGEGDPYPPGGGKNLLDISALTSTNEVEVTNADLTTGTAALKALVTANTYGDVRYVTTLKAGSYTLSGTVSSSASGAIPRIMIARTSDGGTVAVITNTSSSYSFTLSTETEVFMIARLNQSKSISTGDSCTASNVMLRFSDTDPTFAPYSNIRPITGVSSVTVTRTGKNLLPATSWNSVLRERDTYTVSALPDGAILFNGTLESLTLIIHNMFDHSRDTVPTQADSKKWLKNGRYRLLVEANDADARIQIMCYNNPDFSDAYALTPGRQQGAVSFEITDEYKYNFARLALGPGTYDNLKIYPRVYCDGFDIAQFEPYQGQTIVVQLTDGSDPLTVCGGTLDVMTGELTVTYGSNAFTWGSPSGSSVDIGSGYTRKAYKLTNSFPIAEYISGILCDSAPSQGGFAEPKIHIQGDASGNYAYITFPNTLANDFTFRVAYKLATPVTYQLTPQQLATLSGYNAVSTDAGTLSVNYRADPSITLGGD